MNRLNSTVGVLTLICGLAGTAPAQSFLTNGLVAYYPFNGDATDASGNGNDGTDYGIAWVSDRFGNTNGACPFFGNGHSAGPLRPVEKAGDHASGPCGEWTQKMSCSFYF